VTLDHTKSSLLRCSCRPRPRAPMIGFAGLVTFAT
jgi:hypothetical protein